jgi:hypothetical protein
MVIRRMVIATINRVGAAAFIPKGSHGNGYRIIGDRLSLIIVEVIDGWSDVHGSSPDHPPGGVPNSQSDVRPHQAGFSRFRIYQNGLQARSGTPHVHTQRGDPVT